MLGLVLIAGLGFSEAGWIPRWRLQQASSHSASPGFALPAACQTAPPAFDPAPAQIQAAFSADELVGPYQAATTRPGRWIDLTTLQWESATSGWQRLADFHAPRRAQAFPYTPLLVNGQEFQTGIGTYPLSEIVYQLGGEYGALRTQIAVDDSADGRASARFSIYADDVLLYRSPVMLRGDAPITLEVPLLGAEQLRLVVDDADDGATGDYADWLATSVYRPTAGPAAVPGRAQLARAKRPGNVQAAGMTPGSRRPVVGVRGEAVAPLLLEGATSAWFDEAQCTLMLAHPRFRVGLGYGGPDHGRFTLMPVDGEQPALHRASSEILLFDGTRLALAETRPIRDGPWEIMPVNDPDLGSGTQITAYFHAPGDEPVTVELAVFPRSEPGSQRLHVPDE
jgi:hypothetical protein